jgi:hypothetical protein
LFLVQVRQAVLYEWLYTPYLDPTQASNQGWPFQYRVFQSCYATHEVYVEEDGYAKSTLMGSPRLRGLFGTNNNETMTSKPDESEFISTTTPPTTLSRPLIQITFPVWGRRDAGWAQEPEEDRLYLKVCFPLLVLFFFPVIFLSKASN